MKILVAEDHPVNLKMVCIMLKKLGHEVVEAENGKIAVEQFQNHSPQLILMDIQMPEMDGLDACREIRKIEKEKGQNPIPISALSANSTKEDRLQAQKAGMNFFLTKPIKPDHLKLLFQKSSITKSEDKEFNYDELLQMFGNDKHVLNGLLQEFLDGIPDEMGKIHRFALNEEWQELERSLHSLKGQLLNLQSTEASLVFASLEKKVIDGQTGNIREEIQKCESVLSDLTEKIRNCL